jgi:hypothetical protein
MPATVTADYKHFQKMAVDAMGWLTGGMCHSSGKKVIRGDTYGAYLLNGTGDAWIPLITKNKLPIPLFDNHQIELGGEVGCWEITIAPSNANVIYMATTNFVFKTINGGDSWTQCTITGGLTADELNPNYNYSKMCQQKIVVDPGDPNTAYILSRIGNLYVTHDGSTFAKLTTTQLPAPIAPFTSSDTKMMGVSGLTIDDASALVAGQAYRSILYINVFGRGRYKSTDGGASFTLFSATGPMRTVMSTVRLSSTRYLMTEAPATYQGILWELNITNGGTTATWTNHNTAIPTYASRNGFCVTVNPTNANQWVLCSEGGEFAYTLNGGTSWTDWSWPTRTFVATDVPMIIHRITDVNAAQYWTSVGNCFFNEDGTKLFITHGTGVFTVAWNATTGFATPIAHTSVSKGIVQLVGSDAHYLRNKNNRLICTWHDAAMTVIDNWRKQPQTYKLNNGATIRHGMCINTSPVGFNIITVASQWLHASSGGTEYSLDGGDTWNQFLGYPDFSTSPRGVFENQPLGVNGAGYNGNGGGEIHVMSLFTTGINTGKPKDIIWFPSSNRHPVRSADGGATWSYMTFPGVSALDNNATSLDVRNFSVSTYAARAHRFTPDPLTPGRGIVMHFVAGLFETLDYGATWSAITFTGGANATRMFIGGAFHSTIAYVPKGNGSTIPDKPGMMFVCSGRENPLNTIDHIFKRSTDHGRTWVSFADVQEVNFMAFGKEAPGSTIWTLYIVGFVNQVHGVYSSNDWDQATPTWKRHTSPTVNGGAITDSLDGITGLAASWDKYQEVVGVFDGSGGWVMHGGAPNSERVELRAA